MNNPLSTATSREVAGMFEVRICPHAEGHQLSQRRSHQKQTAVQQSHRPPALRRLPARLLLGLLPPAFQLLC